MLKKLRKRSEFLAVAATGVRWVSPAFILQIGEPPSAPHPVRYGLTATRKIGNAVTRNRAKRRLRALAVEIMPHALPRDYVLVARASTPTYPFDSIRQDLRKALKRMKVERVMSRADSASGSSGLALDAPNPPAIPE